MRRLIIFAFMLAALLLPASGAFAQDATPAAEEPDFFASQPGYQGGAQNNFAADAITPEGMILIGGGVAQFDTEENATAALEAIRTGYLDFLASQPDPGFDFSGLALQETETDIADGSALYAGTLTGFENNPDLNIAALFVRQGTVIFGTQAISLLGDPAAQVALVANAILAREPEAAATPIDGDDTESAIWTWLPSYEDVGPGYTMDDRAWTDIDGKETTVDPIVQATPQP